MNNAGRQQSAARQHGDPTQPGRNALGSREPCARASRQDSTTPSSTGTMIPDAHVFEALRRGSVDSPIKSMQAPIVFQKGSLGEPPGKT
eukprot:8677550-Lingulodinium_polyedra.AAC.1